MNGAPVSFVVSKERDQALFLGDDIPRPGDGKVYQLWMIGAQITPNALVDRGGDVTQWMDRRPARGRPAAGGHRRAGRWVDRSPRPIRSAGVEL